MIRISLNTLHHKFDACHSGMGKLLKGLGFITEEERNNALTYVMNLDAYGDYEVSYREILRHCGEENFMWSLRTLPVLCRDALVTKLLKSRFDYHRDVRIFFIESDTYSPADIEEILKFIEEWQS